jgi:D-hydroxyproline dehydrogenase subunit gamma
MTFSDLPRMPSNLHVPIASVGSAASAEPEPGPQFVRLAERQRPPLAFVLDGKDATALAGDTVLTAILMQQRSVRHSEFSGEPRAGFCLIGACQDCWVRSEDGTRLRACSTLLAAGMRIVTRNAVMTANTSVASTASTASINDGVAP